MTEKTTDKFAAATDNAVPIEIDQDGNVTLPDADNILITMRDIVVILQQQALTQKNIANYQTDIRIFDDVWVPSSWDNFDLDAAAEKLSKLDTLVARIEQVVDLSLIRDKVFCFSVNSPGIPRQEFSI